MHTTPTGNITEAPELGTPRYKGQNCWFPMAYTIESCVSSGGAPTPAGTSMFTT